MASYTCNNKTQNPPKILPLKNCFIGLHLALITWAITVNDKILTFCFPAIHVRITLQIIDGMWNLSTFIQNWTNLNLRVKKRSSLQGSQKEKKCGHVLNSLCNWWCIWVVGLLIATHSTDCSAHLEIISLFSNYGGGETTWGTQAMCSISLISKYSFRVTLYVR